jgi:anionic cell wall polymer biosynthesis LytR-Cps2A-Psr (LCP) family protein
MENVITAITGIMPDKYAVFDMSSFAAIIDDVGGIDLDVKKAITDASYPGSNYTYKKVSFNKGEQHMDGARALEYARSRESTTDFDRAGRQQQIILALKQKAEAMDLKDNLDQLTQIYGDVKDRLKTDVSALDALNYYTNYRSFDISDGNVLSTQNYLYSTYDSAGQYILLPYKDSFMAIQNYLLGLIGA